MLPTITARDRGGAPLSNFIRVNQTSTTAWSLIWSVPQAVSPYQNRGAMLANEPWSGHYFVDGTIWVLLRAHLCTRLASILLRTAHAARCTRYRACLVHSLPRLWASRPPNIGGALQMYAHWTQFAEIGWKMLGVPTGGSGAVGSAQWVTLVSDTTTDYSVILDFLQAPTQRLELSFSNLPRRTLAVWQTNETDQFVKSATLIPEVNGSVFLTATHGSIYTVTTLTTPTKGDFPNVPPSQPFPLPYTDTFDSYGNDTMARYFADQGGSFSVLTQLGGGGVLAQVVPHKPGPNAWINDPDPVTLIGDLTWSNVSVFAQARLGTRSTVASGAGSDAASSPVSDNNNVVLTLDRCSPTSPFQEWNMDTPYPQYIENARTNQCLNQYGCGKNAAVITWACVPGINAGCTEFPSLSNLRWRLVGAHLILNVTGQCVASTPTGIVTVDCITPPPPAQSWQWDPTSKHLVNVGKCLSTPPLQTYVEVCGRISQFQAFAGPAKANNGVCLRLHGSDVWELREGDALLANGTTRLPTGTTWHALQLDLAADTVVGRIDGVAVTPATTRVNVTAGSVSLGSGWHPAFFDNFSMTAL